MKIIEGIKFKELPTFYGAIIEEGEMRARSLISSILQRMTEAIYKAILTR